MGDEIIKVLDHLGYKFGVAIDWSSTNVLPYLQDLMARVVKYEIYTSITWIAIFILGIFVLLLIIKFIKDEDLIEWAKLALCVWAIISIIGISTEIFDIIEINTIPEKYIIRMINNEINNE